MKYFYILALFTQFAFSQDAQENKDEYRNKGYFNITRFSYVAVGKVKQDLFIPGEGNFSNTLPSDKSNAFSIQTINGYFISPYFSVGVGVGLDGYSNPNINTFPIFVDIRAYFKDDFNSPYLFLDFGGLAKISDDFNRGNIFNVGAGYKIFVNQKRRIALVPEIGWSAKTISLTDEKIKTSDNKVDITGVHLGLGIIF